MRTPTAPASRQAIAMEPTRKCAAYDGYVAYFGTYDVDESRGEVIHHVEGSLMPSYTDTEQPRPIKVDGDELVIEPTTSEGHFYRHLRRAGLADGSDRARRQTQPAPDCGVETDAQGLRRWKSCACSRPWP